MNGKRGFTLIELLVVISIVSLLMAILMPTLQHARNQARAVVCQSNLKQWGTLMAMYLNENDGCFPEPLSPDDPDYDQGWRGWHAALDWGWGSWGWGGPWGSRDSERYDETKGIRCCPMASRPADPSGSAYPPVGGTFLAWGRFWPVDADDVPEPYNRYSAHGSYGFNGALGRPWRYGHDPDADMYERVWRTADIRGRGRIPVYYDCAWPMSLGVGDGCADPPEYDAVPTAIEPHAWKTHCINRHGGGINALFLDWSVRKVGLKELWTLEWHRQYNTSGPWTEAGGARPGDWPQWMRSFKDY